jgi:hypothetical protein
LPVVSCQFFLARSREKRWLLHNSFSMTFILWNFHPAALVIPTAARNLLFADIAPSPLRLKADC